MKLVPYVVFGFREPALDRIVLSASERATLKRAAAILDAVQESRRGRVPTDWYSHDEDDHDLSFGRSICDELATTGQIDAEAVAS